MDNFKFEPYSSIGFVGGSQTGKTSMINTIICNLDRYFKDPVPEFILYCYSKYQDSFDKVKECLQDKVLFHQDMPPESMIKEIGKKYKNPIIIFEDIFEKYIDTKKMLSLFLEGVHHDRLTVFYVLHNLFFASKNRRSLQLSTQYYVIFPTKSDGLSYEMFARRMGSERSKEFKEVLLDVMKDRRYCSAVIDLHPGSYSKFMVWSKILPNQNPVGYMID